MKDYPKRIITMEQFTEHGTTTLEPPTLEIADTSARTNEVENGNTEEQEYVLPTEWYLPDISKLITETDEPVDNIFSAKQQRLLVESLMATAEQWNPDSIPFLADANVGIFTTQDAPPLVPDVFLSMDIDEPKVFDYSHIRSYFLWVFGKVPDIVVEIVSNRKGGEMDAKRRKYARLHIPFYIVFDPFGELRGAELTVYALERTVYTPLTPDENGMYYIPDMNLGVQVCESEYERSSARWLRWCAADGTLLPTGRELATTERNRANQAQQRAEYEQQRAEREQQRAEREQQRAEHEQQRAEREQQRAEREQQRAEREQQRAEAAEQKAAQLAEKLRAMGINPDEI
jgi:Uma2 family endonuclease